MQNLLIIGHTWPEPKTTGAGVRMMQLINTFINKNFKITFASTAEKTNYSEDLNLIGIQEVSIKLNDSSFDDFVKQLNPDVVVFDRFYTEEQFGWRVAEICPNAVRILDTEDLHFLRLEREEALKSNRNVNYTKSAFALREIASIYRSDLSLIISKSEMELLQNTFKIEEKLLHYLPFYATKVEVDKLPGFEKREHFIFVGNFKHKPNSDAIWEIKKNVWPKIAKTLPQAEIHFYGAYTDEKIKQLHNPKERFFINGWVEDITEVLKSARLMLAPLRFGAGLKTKFIDALQCGTPFVTTSVGIEGLGNIADFSNQISDDKEKLTDLAIKIYSDEILWQEIQNRGFEIHKQFLSTFAFDDFFEKLKWLCDNIENHREENFTGAMLMHHTTQSTKYLSKWIEVKNKN